MSIQYQRDDCYLLSHQAMLNDIYLAAVDEGHHNISAYTYANPHRTGHLKTFEVNAKLFAINSSYVRDQQTPSPTAAADGAVDVDSTKTNVSRKRNRKRKGGATAGKDTDNDALREMQELINTVTLKYLHFEKCAHADQILPAHDTVSANNEVAISFAQNIQDDTPAPYSFRGENSLYHAVLSTISSTTYLIPPRCEFYQDDVRNIDGLLGVCPADGPFDLVVIDPPWWNRYVRRAKRAKQTAGYQMLDSQAIEDIPLERYVGDGSLVAIWCTNAPAHGRLVLDVLLAKWSLRLLSTWYWVKVTRTGRPVCEFREPLQKQPFERLFVACQADSDMERFAGLREPRYLFSVPSAVHSHKPPVIDLFKQLLPSTPKCLEIFARYLLPNFTSIGNEVLKMQNRKLFVNVDAGEDDADDAEQTTGHTNTAE